MPLKKHLVLVLLILPIIFGCAKHHIGIAHFERYRPPITEYMRTPAILVFSGTHGWRHNEGISGADLFFTELASARGYGIYTTEHPGIFNKEDLSRFEVVIFNNVSGGVLNEEQRSMFEHWMLNGGSWIGLHGSGDYSMGDWNWYQSNLIGARFIGHTMGPQVQKATLVNLNSNHPIMINVPKTWEHEDEWYSFDKIPDMPGLQVLIGTDETTYESLNNVVPDWPENLRMGSTPDKHPIAWALCTPNFRAVYSAIGHMHKSFDETVYRQFLTNAFDWVRDSSEATLLEQEEQACPQ